MARLAVRPPGSSSTTPPTTEMHTLAERRLAGEIPDTLILLEHPPVFTAGRRWKPEHIVWTEERIAAAGAELRFIDRGGSLTFHGPGQLVGTRSWTSAPRPDADAVSARTRGGRDPGLGRRRRRSSTAATSRPACGRDRARSARSASG